MSQIVDHQAFRYPPITLIRRALVVRGGPFLFRRQGVIRLRTYRRCRKHPLPGDMS